MEWKVTSYVLVATFVFSILFSLGLIPVDVGASSQNSLLNSAGNALLISRIWQIAGIPMLVFFLVKRFRPRFFVVPLLLLVLLAWVFVESSLGFPLSPFSIFRDSLLAAISFAAAAWSLFLTFGQERTKT